MQEHMLQGRKMEVLGTLHVKVSAIILKMWQILGGYGHVMSF